MTATLMERKKTLMLQIKNATSLLFINTCGNLKVHPTGFEPVTTGSVDGSKIRFSLALSFFPIRLCGKYASIFCVF